MDLMQQQTQSNNSKVRPRLFQARMPGHKPLAPEHEIQDPQNGPRYCNAHVR